MQLLEDGFIFFLIVHLFLFQFVSPCAKLPANNETFCNNSFD